MEFYRTSDDDLAEWLVVPRDARRPFVHKFEVDSHKYLFDVNTGQIVRVSDAVWTIMDDWGRISNDEMLQKYAARCGAAALRDACDEITQAQERDQLFLPLYPSAQDLEYSLREEEIRMQCEHRRLVSLNVTERCNFRCSYCIYGGGSPGRRTHSERDMTWTTAKAALDDFLDHSVPGSPPAQRGIGFYGGEPLLNFALIKDGVSYIRGKGQHDVQFHVTTNGYLLNDEVGDFLVEHDFLVQVSVDGATAIHDRHRRLRNGSPTFAVVDRNIRAFLARHPVYRGNARLMIHATLAFGTDAREAEKFFCADLYGVSDDGIHVTAALADAEGIPREDIGAASATDNRFPGLNELHDEYLRQCASGKVLAGPLHPTCRLKKALFHLGYLDLHRRRVAPRGQRLSGTPLGARCSCIPGAKRMFVATDGRYFPCVQVPEAKLLVLGDARNGLIMGKVYELAKKVFETNREECRCCWCVRNCMIGCYSNIREGVAFTAQAKRQACAEYRRKFHHRLIRYCRVLERNPHAFDYMNKGKGRTIVLEESRTANGRAGADAPDEPTPA